MDIRQARIEDLPGVLPVPISSLLHYIDAKCQLDKPSRKLRLEILYPPCLLSVLMRRSVSCTFVAYIELRRYRCGTSYIPKMQMGIKRGGADVCRRER